MAETENFIPKQKSSVFPKQGIFPILCTDGEKPK
jgi:hypothetical protein